MKETQSKKSTFELMRIISMFLIVLYHIIHHGKLIENAPSLTQEITFNFLKSLTLIGVNSFIILSGYFQSKSHFKVKKFFLIIIQFIFYKTIIFLILGFFQIVPLTKEFLISYYNPQELEYWFIFYYLILYMLSNYLNKIIHIMNLKVYTLLIILLTITLSITPMLSNGIIVTNTGFSLIQFIYLYFIGAYLRIISEKFKTSKKTKYYFLLAYIILSILIVVVYYVASNSIVNNITIEGIIRYSFYYSNPLVIFQSISYFMFFNSLNFTNKNINNFAKYILGVYLIHDNSLIRERLYFFNNIIINNNSIISSITLTLIFTFIIFFCAYLINYTISKIFLAFTKKIH